MSGNCVALLAGMKATLQSTELPTHLGPGELLTPSQPVGTVNAAERARALGEMGIHVGCGLSTRLAASDSLCLSFLHSMGLMIPPTDCTQKSMGEGGIDQLMVARHII